MIKIVLMSDASFPNAKGSKSELGFVILLLYGKRNANIVHYSSRKCRRVTRSVGTVDLHDLVEGFDADFVIKEMITDILGREAGIDTYVDSNTVLDVISKDRVTTEKVLLIYVHALRQSYKRGAIDQIAWIPGVVNAADAMTKHAIS